MMYLSIICLAEPPKKISVHKKNHFYQISYLQILTAQKAIPLLRNRLLCISFLLYFLPCLPFIGTVQRYIFVS